MKPLSDQGISLPPNFPKVNVERIDIENIPFLYNILLSDTTDLQNQQLKNQ
jgi:hypothetical protein